MLISTLPLISVLGAFANLNRTNFCEVIFIDNGEPP